MNDLFAARVGCELLRGAGWIAPVLVSADWPLARFAVNQQGLRVSASIFGFGPTLVEVPLEAVRSLRPIWCGMSVEYVHEREQRELLLYSPFLWSRFQSWIVRHHLVIPAVINSELPLLSASGKCSLGRANRARRVFSDSQRTTTMKP